MEKLQQTQRPQFRVFRRLKLLMRKKYQLDAYLIRKNGIRINDTPIPHHIDRFIISNFDHKNFTGLYFKNAPLLGHFREVLFFTTLQAGPVGAVDFIKTLATKREARHSEASFYRQIKFEFTALLTKRILNSKRDYIEHFANKLMGEKWPKHNAEFIVREVLNWTDKWLLHHEMQLEVEPVSTEDINAIKSISAICSWKDHKQAFYMWALMPTYTDSLNKLPGFSKKKWLKRLACCVDFDLPDNFETPINGAIANGTYNDLAKAYMTNFEIADKLKEGKRHLSRSKFKKST